MDVQKALEGLAGYDPDVRNGVVLELCSGGDRKSSVDPLPALFLDKTVAELALVLAVEKEVGDKRWSWVRKPKTDIFQITEAEGRPSVQRLSKDRYGSHCAIEVAKDA